MVDITFYLVTKEIAQRSGVIESRYRTKDGRFILDNKDLSYIRFTPDEYIDGLTGVEKISKQDAMILIKENNYQVGVERPIATQQEVVENTTEEDGGQANEAQSEEIAEETPDKEDSEETNEQWVESSEEDDADGGVNEETTTDESNNEEQETNNEQEKEEE